MTFRVGQKVVCVDDADTACVIKGNIYDVCRIGGRYLYLDRLEPAAAYSGGMLKKRFRPVVEKKTDISIFTALLNTKQHENVCGND